MNQGTILGGQIGRWVVLAALVVVLGALLLTIRPAGAQDAPPSGLVTAKSVHYYPENHTTLDVHPYSVSEPDNDKVFWTLSGLDAAAFTIEGGTLRFKRQPNYEVPTDRLAYTDTNNNGEFDAGEPVLEAAKDNAYRVTVRSSGGGEGGEPGSETDDLPDDHDGNDLDELEVTVHVTNFDEDGKVNLSSLQPQVGTTLTATVADPDGVTIVGSWQWASSDSMNGPFTDIAEQSNRQTYQPVDADLGKYLRVTARYRDNASKVDSDIREEMAVSSHTVRKDVISSNQDPNFPDQKTLLGGNDIVRENTERFIRENSPAGTKVGAPVTAFDDNTELEVLTYSLIGAHRSSFNIHQVTGQITVSAAAKLNADGADDTLGAADTPYRVTVVATDGDGESQTIDVVIRVVGYNEPPRIRDGAREMTHWEVDRTDRSATTIDTDLDSSVIVYSGTPPTPDGNVNFANYQDADYTATDPDAADRADGVLTGDTTVMWSLAGPDAEKFFIFTNEVAGTADENPDTRTIATTVTIDAFDDFEDDVKPHLTTTGDSARLAFKAGPDFEKLGDKNKDNVYEVTIVVTDSVGNTGEYPVTVKVKNSTDDNKPGKVTVLNRQPEIKARLEAKLVDVDGGLSKVTWQWYRLETTGDPNTDAVGRARCADYDPRAPSTAAAQAIEDAQNVRSFVDPDLLTDDVSWENWGKIPGAKGTGVNAHYTPGYDERVGGEVERSGDEDQDNDPATPNTPKVESWTGGDINVVITTTPANPDASPATREFTTYAWEDPRCLRVAFMYKDAVDRTNAKPDDNDTPAVDETLEGAYKGSEFPVKRPDDRNDAPVFTEDGMDDGEPVSLYMNIERKENVQPFVTGTNETDGATRRINEAFPATDTMVGEDDDNDGTRNPPADGTPANADSPGRGPGADILTYSLSGPDANYFKITGTAETRLTGTYDTTNVNDLGGTLEFKTEDELKAVGLPDLDFETQRVFTVIITVADPSGDKKATATVTVNLTDYNEMPKWVIGTSPTRVVYAEDRTDAVAQYKAKDPEATVNYGLVRAAVTSVTPAITDLQIADRGLFKIDPLNGTLSFKSSPNYEKPGDGDHDATLANNTRDNMYQVVVSATDTDVKPGGPYTIYRRVTVVVTDVNEAPWFAESTDTLEITENPDDPEKEPPAAHSYLYLLNRGVGKPAANLPAAPNLDVGIPVAAADDDSTATFPVGGYTEDPDVIGNRDRIDGLTYTLSGTDAGYFHIVPATGQILTKVKLDYEAKDEYKVTVTATDPDGESDSIDMTIKVTNLDEQNVPKALLISGDALPTYSENGTDAVGEYTAAAGGGATPGRWSLEGPDASNFRLEGTGVSRMLKFSSSPDYESPMGGANDDSNTYEVTLKVTDPSDSDVAGTFGVTVTVTDVDELGTLAGNGSPTYAENGTDAVETYTLSGGDGTSTVRWTLDGADATHFRLDGTSMSKMLEFTSVPDHEAPADADTNNTYMVAVKAEAGGEMDMVEVTVTVTDVSELGTLAGSIGFLHAEGGTDTGETYTLSGGDGTSTVSWMLDGADVDHFRLDGTGMSRMLMFEGAPDYEVPADADTDNTYMVTVKAEAGGEMDMVEVNVTVIDVDELGMVDGMEIHSYAENGDDAVATYTVDSGTMADTAMWTLGGADASQFTLDGTGMSRMLMFRSAPDYEMPADADTNNTYMVAVKAEAGSEIQMVEVTVIVTDVDELGALSGPGSFTQAEGGTDAMETYMISGGDGSTVSWMLDGADASHFMLDGTGMSRMLMFESAPDYESPMGGANDDSNTYMVTVKAEAGGEMEMVEVAVMVTNEEEMGTVSLSPESPVAGSPVTATLTDPDGGITDLTWTWETSSDMATWSAATGAVVSEGTTSIYTSVEDDADEYLRATASYTDSYDSGNSESGVSGVVVDADVNVAPEFPSGPATRSIAENTAAGTNIGAPVAATDANGDTLVYSLEGTDMASFGIVANTGQLTTLAALDFESKNAYTVVVKATDPAGLSDTIEVTINVTDVDDTPVDTVDPVETYDTDGTPGISISELFDAIDAYFDPEIELSLSDLFDVIDAYFAING